MDSRIRKYCKHICKVHIETLRYDKNTHTCFWDLPAMATICHDLYNKRQNKGFSHNPRGTKWHQQLKNRLMKLGPIGQHSQIGKRYIIGNCAEQHAGNNYMNKYKENNVNNLYFTEAVRPRTMEVFPSCDNCKEIFPNL